MTTLLLVEDNEMNRDMLSRRLIRRGFDVLYAMDGEQAVSMASQHQPDLVLMDMSLPVMSGWDATKALRAKDETKDLPIIALTGHAMDGDRQEALAAGCDEYDTKPVDMTRLLAKINKLLHERSPTPGLLKPTGLPPDERSNRRNES